MPRSPLSLTLLALCFAACAVPAGAAESAWPDRARAVESAEPAAGELDLSFEPTVSPSTKPHRPALRPGPASSSDETERRFSLGLNIKTRPEIGDEVRESPDAATLSDEVEGLVRRSTFGLTGTYRF